VAVVRAATDVATLARRYQVRVRTGHARTGHARTGHASTGHARTGHARTGHDTHRTRHASDTHAPFTTRTGHAQGARCWQAGPAWLRLSTRTRPGRTRTGRTRRTRGEGIAAPTGRGCRRLLASPSLAARAAAHAAHAAHAVRRAIASVVRGWWGEWHVPSGAGIMWIEFGDGWGGVGGRLQRRRWRRPTETSLGRRSGCRRGRQCACCRTSAGWEGVCQSEAGEDAENGPGVSI
jgi:hypothetical protein